VRLAKQVGATGGTFPAVFNGANEECVGAFLAGRLPFPAIVDTIERVVADHARSDRGSDRDGAGELTLEAVLAADAWARNRARELTAQ
jgi:1-deoxy-D-xylulose-5-phosphate reductoisomerase